MKNLSSGIIVDSDEQCYYCENKAIYWDQAGTEIISVCIKHSKNYYVS